MKGTHFNWYSKRILKRYPLARTLLESGMLLDIRYAPETTGGPIRSYIVLALHKGVGAFNEKRKFHLLAIEHMPPAIFEKFVDYVGLEYSTIFKKVRKLKLEKLLMEQRGAKKFYIRELKQDINTKFKNTYRTFNIGSIKSIKVLDFDFPGNASKILDETMKKLIKKGVDEKIIKDKFDGTGLKE